MVVASINGRVFYPGLATATEGVAANPMLPPPLLFWVASLVVLWPSAYLGSGSAHRR